MSCATNAPYHFEQPSRSLRVSAEFVRRVDLPVSWHINSLELGMEAIEKRACTAFNVACVVRRPDPYPATFCLGGGGWVPLPDRHGPRIDVGGVGTGQRWHCHAQHQLALRPHGAGAVQQSRRPWKGCGPRAAICIRLKGRA